MSASRFAAAVALAMVAGGPAAAQLQAPVVTVSLYSYGYAPDPINLAAGRPVTLVFVNRAGKGHDFTARRFFRSARIVAGSVDDGEVGLGPGRSKSVMLVPARGTYKIHCGHFFHKQLGMTGTIIVR